MIDVPFLNAFGFQDNIRLNNYCTVGEAKNILRSRNGYPQNTDLQLYLRSFALADSTKLGNLRRAPNEFIAVRVVSKPLDGSFVSTTRQLQNEKINSMYQMGSGNYSARPAPVLSSQQNNDVDWLTNQTGLPRSLVLDTYNGVGRNREIAYAHLMEMKS